MYRRPDRSRPLMVIMAWGIALCALAMCAQPEARPIDPWRATGNHNHHTKASGRLAVKQDNTDRNGRDRVTVVGTVDDNNARNDSDEIDDKDGKRRVPVRDFRAFDLSPLDPTDGPCESVLEDETCYRRCGCEWCGPGRGHGCHSIPPASASNTTGPCDGGKPGRRDAFWSCHREAVAWIAGGAVGAMATVFLIVLGLCWCHRKKVAARCCCCPWRRRGDRRHMRINDDGTSGDVWLGGYVSMPRYVNP